MLTMILNNSTFESHPTYILKFRGERRANEQSSPLKRWFVSLNAFQIKLKFSPQGMFALCDIAYFGIFLISFSPYKNKENKIIMINCVWSVESWVSDRFNIP